MNPEQDLCIITPPRGMNSPHRIIKPVFHNYLVHAKPPPFVPNTHLTSNMKLLFNLEKFTNPEISANYIPPPPKFKPPPPPLKSSKEQQAVPISSSLVKITPEKITKVPFIKPPPLLLPLSKFLKTDKNHEDLTPPFKAPPASYIPAPTQLLK
jgi:hypothetical protein